MKMHPPIQPPLPEIPLVDNMFAPEILAGGLTGLSLLNGIVTVTLENSRADHGRPDPGLERVIVGRIGMPIPTAQDASTATTSRCSCRHAAIDFRSDGRAPVRHTPYSA